MRAKIQQGKGGEKREKVVVVKGEERGGKVTGKSGPHNQRKGRGHEVKTKGRDKMGTRLLKTPQLI